MRTHCILSESTLRAHCGKGREGKGREGKLTRHASHLQVGARPTAADAWALRAEIGGQ